VSVFSQIAALATHQHGCVHLDQLRSIGLSRGRIRTLVRSEFLQAHGPGVYSVVGASPTWRQRVMIEVMLAGPQAFGSQRAAAALWQFDRFRPGAIDVLSPRWVRRRSGQAIRHETVDLKGCDRSEVSGIPVTSPTRTLIDMGRFVGVHRLGEMLDDAVRRRLTTYEEVHGRFRELARSGRNGITTMRAVLQDRPCGAPPPGSAFETVVRRLLVGAGLPAAVLQHRVQSEELSFLLDLAWPDRMVAVECEGFAFHRTPSQLAWDDMRRNRLQLAGWTVLAYTWATVRNEPDRVVAEVRAALG
jgi:very-short-patch-repair endonuclease